MKYAFILLFSFTILTANAQEGYDNTMVFGYQSGSGSPTNDEFGLNILTYTDGNLNISDNQSSEAWFNDTDAAISDKDGNLLFYFDGKDIYNKQHEIMDNGDTLITYSGDWAGYDLTQGAMIIPFPTRPNWYVLFHAKYGYTAPWGPSCTGLYFSIVSMTQNGGLGKVIVRKVPLVVDTLENTKLVAVRHANGRDWWLLVGEFLTNRYYRILLTRQGPVLMDTQSVGPVRGDTYGQAFISPDGQKYVMYGVDGLFPQYFQVIDIFDFDRCTGMLSNPERFSIYTGDKGNGGIAVSPNSRWLYLATLDWMYKYDLWADPVEPSKQLIATYEPFNDPFPTKYHLGYLAPDDKIYFTTTSGSRTLHVIHDPDEPGMQCNFQQHGIRLACHNANSLPTFANYRLGPVDGSVCDTLGIDNMPVSWWRYEQDTLEPNHISFHDLSYHEPATWQWDFGDGHVSAERHPEHTYALPGEYEVCLTVSNTYGSDTHCKTMYGVTAGENPEVQASIWVGPNPVHERLAVALSTQLRSPEFLLYDAFGRLVKRERVYYGLTELDVSGLGRGMYFWELRSGGERVKSGKVWIVGG